MYGLVNANINFFLLLLIIIHHPSTQALPHKDLKMPDEAEDKNEEASDERPPRKGVPRRATSESLSYLSSLEPLINKSLAAANQQQNNGGQDGGEDMEDADASLLVNNLIDELTFQVSTEDVCHSDDVRLCVSHHQSSSSLIVYMHAL